MKSALLLIDLQQDFLEPRSAAPLLVSRAAELLRACRERKIPIIHVWTTVERGKPNAFPHWQASNQWKCVAGTPGHETPEPLRPLTGESIVHKTGFNAFASGELDQLLRAAGCDSVILCGVHLHACVRTAAVESLERNLKVFIAEDATGSNDPIHAAATRRWLAARCVTFQSVRGAIPSDDQTGREARPSSPSPHPSGEKAGMTGSVSHPTALFPSPSNPKKTPHCSPRDTSEILFSVRNFTPEEITTATHAAQDVSTHWRRTPLAQRQQILNTIAEKLLALESDLARQIAIDLGKPIRHAREEIRRAAANIQDVIQRAPTALAPKREPAGWLRREPLGVVAVISAWNNPVAIPLGKIAPALIYGNAVAWKPAPAATRISETLMRLFRQCDFPDGAVTLVTGDHTAAQILAGDKNVNAVTLTSSIAAGHAIQEICARRITPLQMELSGNNAAIVWRDADFKTAAAQIAWGAFAFAGQRCTANRRVIVHHDDFEKFVTELESAAARLPWGDPLDPATEIGPVLNSGKRDELAALIALAQSEGALHRVIYPHAKHTAAPWVKSGAYAQPVIACCDTPTHPIVQEETMSPLLVVQRADDFHEALEYCNAVRHGLIAALFTQQADLQQKFLEEAQAGILKFNSSTAGVHITLPFGGWKASGLGPPEHGAADIEFYTRLQAIYGLETL